jgi:uncharacterized membrane protein
MNVNRSNGKSKCNGLGLLGEPELAPIVERNIKSIEEHRHQAEESRNLQERIADFITRVSGSLGFVFAHVIWFVVWILANVGILGVPAFDPFPFGLLTTIVSLEAIFLSTFVLVSQNRQASVADRRAQLDLQINLLAEYEVTRLLKLQYAMAKRLGIDEKCDAEEIRALEEDIEPEALLRKLEVQENDRKNGDKQKADLKSDKHQKNAANRTQGGEES